MKDLETMSTSEFLQEVWTKAEEMNRLTPRFKRIYEKAKEQMLAAETRGENPLEWGGDAVDAMEVFLENPETDDITLYLLATIP